MTVFVVVGVTQVRAQDKKTKQENKEDYGLKSYTKLGKNCCPFLCQQNSLKATCLFLAYREFSAAHCLYKAISVTDYY